MLENETSSAGPDWFSQAKNNAGGNGNGHGYGHNGGGPGNHNGGGYGDDYDPNPVPIDGIVYPLILTAILLAIKFKKLLS